MKVCYNTPKAVFLIENINNEAENHVPLTFYCFKNRGGDFTMLKYLVPSHLLSDVPQRIGVMTETRRQNGAIKCMQFPIQKLII